jgi:hypothetical protein
MKINGFTVSSFCFSSSAYASALGSLLRQFKGKFKSITVPCYVASGETTNPGELPYR